MGVERFPFKIFVVSVWSHWEARFGTTFTVILALSQYTCLKFFDPQRMPKWVKEFPPGLWLFIGACLFFWACYGAWREKYDGLNKSEKMLEEAINKDRPELFSTLVFGPGNGDGEGSIGVENRGNRDAFNVQIQAFPIFKKNLSFAPMPILSKSQGKVFPLMEINGLDQFDEMGELRRLIHSWAVRANSSKIELPLTVMWSDASGNDFRSTCIAVYDANKDKCRTVMGPVKRVKLTPP